ncbi:uncharacterized protein LOC116018863 [Ipomoea triloba]|uniref:uncharacterized protein LOC116018863 n=1 Tax=Ipomoea triloba TaxID=35885 RepID=UPI00125DD730|nr:uncharacterized protein LOC116018863 [Ipomoea triloba]
MATSGFCFFIDSDATKGEDGGGWRFSVNDGTARRIIGDVAIWSPGQLAASRTSAMVKRDGEAGKADANSISRQLRGEERWQMRAGLPSVSLSSPLLQAAAAGFLRCFFPASFPAILWTKNRDVI